MTGRIEVWWRDDDAVDRTPQLVRLLEFRRRRDVPLALAVVPSKARPTLSDLEIEGEVDVLVHGFAHIDHATLGERKAEFIGRRNSEEMRHELRKGLQLLKGLQPRALPVFVPPWNRMPNALVAELPSLGFCGLSAWGAEDKWPAVQGLHVANAHIDILDWKSAGVPKTRQQLSNELRLIARTCRRFGILTHHLQMPDAAFENLEWLFQEIDANPSFAWTSAKRIFIDTVRVDDDRAT